MKKWLVASLIGLLLVPGLIYLLIPATLIIDRSVDIKIAPQASSRLIQKEENWARWWPGIKRNQAADPILVYHHSVFTIDEKIYNGLRLSIQNGSDSLNSLLNIIALGYDSVSVKWVSLINTGWDPVSRIRRYRKSEKIGADMKDILEAMRSFLSKQENVYGMQIRREVVKDTLLIATKEIFNEYPGTSSVYKMVRRLRDHIRSQGGKEISPPMLHVDQLGQNSYQAMVAIATDKEISGAGNINFKRMVPGYMLVAEVKGGRASIHKALSEVENLISDYQRTSPAIPYELMITDRSHEQDTAKWVTKIYYPIVL